MIPVPPAYFAAQIQAAQHRRTHGGMQAVPNMESDAAKQSTGSIFNDCVLDLSKYLSSSDLPASPGEFFDDLFHSKMNNKNSLQKHLPDLIKVKEEPDSTATSRCSTPESLLPEHDFDNGDFPTPQFNGVNAQNEKEGSLMRQLQSIPHSNVTSDNDSETEVNVDDLNRNAQQLKDALAQLEVVHPEDDSMNDSLVSPPPYNLKSPRHKIRKAVSKGSEEYLVKRERNNVAVRKSRTKAKLKHIETQMRVGELTEENAQLRNRVAALQKELDAMKNFFAYNSSSVKVPSCFSYTGTYPSSKIL